MYYKFPLFIFIAVILIASAACPLIENARTDFYNINSMNDIDNFLSKYNTSSSCGAMPAYSAALIMRKAQYVSDPMKKLKFFHQGKKILEDFIAKNPNDVEGRFNRYLVQKSIPGILGYHGDITDDYNFIKNNIQSSTINDDYKKKMISTINSLNK